MMKKLMVLVVLCSFVVQGCASYKASRLPSSNINTYSNYQDQDGLKVAIKFLDAHESKTIFAKEKVYRLYQPLYIVIDNQSDQTYLFKKQMINRITIPALDVAKECGFSTTGRAAGYGVGALFFLPLAIPAVVDGVKSKNANQEMREDYMYKEIKDEAILPQHSLSGIVFIKKIKTGEDVTLQLVQKDDSTQVKTFRFVK